MKVLDRISAIFLLLLGLAVLFKGIQLGSGMGIVKGPGLMPSLAGGFLALLSIALLLQTFRKGETIPKVSLWVNRYGWKSILLTILAICLYPVILNRLGFLLSTFALLFFLFRVVARLRWTTSMAGAVCAAVLVYLVFEVWLKANMPHGIWGF